MNKKVIAALLAVCLVVSTGCSKEKKNAANETVAEATPVVTADAQEQEEPMLVNGDFSKPNESPEAWQTYSQGGAASFSIVDGKGVLTVSTTGSVNYGVQLYQDIGALTQGCVYRLSFDISASVPRTIEYRIQINGGDYHAYAGKEALKLSKDMQTETLEFKFEEASDPAPRFVFNCGMFDDTDGIGEHEIYLDNVSLEMIDDSNAVKAEAVEAPSRDINVNQIGYLPNAKKTAVFRGDAGEASFEVVNTETNKTVFTGKIENEKENTTAGETDYYGDFSEVNEPGTYMIKAGKFGESYEFKIQDNIYDSCYGNVVKMLYRQRCGTKLDETIAKEFTHDACHMSKATIYGTKKKLDVSGGWHDAGDYGRYVVAGAKTVMDLFLTYEQDKENSQDDIGIPESGNKVPDILDEARYELEWMFKMQDKKSGGVYHKVTCANFPGDDVLPQDETDELIICPVSTTATYDFASVMAEASVLYKEYDKAFAAKCEKAAKRAMGYAEKAGSDGGFKNPEGIGTGQYDDETTRDERYWACAELYKITKNTEYIDTMAAIVKNGMPEGFGWQSVGDYGTYIFLTTPEAKDQEIYQVLYDYFMKQADTKVEDSNNDGYKISIGSEYVWGSNLSVANNAMYLILANNIKANESYLDTASDHMHYCLGVNPMSISYVTGYGSLSPEHVHHRPSYALQSVVPGMLAGGPDKALEDPYASAVLKDAPPAKCYVDNHASYSTNEVSIYWNSPFIFMMNALK